MRLRRILMGLSATLVVITPRSAMAKPPFTVEVSPGSPSVGQVVEVAVRFWDDGDPPALAHWPSRGSFEAFLWAHPQNPSAADPLRAIPIDITSVRRGVMRGELTFPSAGLWTVCSSFFPCDDESEGRGDSGRTDVTVSARAWLATAALAREAGVAPSGRPTALFGQGASAAATLVLVLAALGLGRSRRKGRSPQGGPP